MKNLTFSKVSMSIAALALLAVFGLAGCGSGGGGGGGNASVSDPNAPPSTLAIGSIITKSSNVTIPATDTKAEIPGYLSVNLPSGSIQRAETVTVSLTNTIQTVSMFDVASEIFQVRGRQSYEHRINIGKTAPLTDNYAVTITLPNDFIANLQPTDTIVTFAQLETEDVVEFEAIESTYDTNNKTISINLASGYFSNLLTADGTYEAVIVISVVNSGQIAATASASAKLRAIGLPTWSYKEGINSPLINLEEVTPPRGFADKQPLYGHYIHKGVDLRAGVGTPVIAAADGEISSRVQRKSYPNGPMDPNGFGYYAVIKHYDGSSTVYAHLESLPANGQITKGKEFARSGMTGGATGPHLHFELIPSGVIPDSVLPPKLIRVDPWPWIQPLVYVTGDQNGAEEPSHYMQISDPPLQLKAIGFAPNANGKYSIAEDSHRNAISVEDITWKSSDENIATVDSKGLVTAKNNGKVTITATQSWSNMTGKSVIVTISTTTGTAPSAPTSVIASAGNGQATISWNAVSGATSYNLYWSTVSGVTKTNGTKISNATSPYTHTGRTNGTTYYYVVTALNSYGESVESSQVSAVPSSGTVLDVTAPSNTTASNFINSGASSSSSTSVTLAISATDAVGVAAYYVSETSTMPSASASGWTAITSTTSYSASVSFTLSSGDGTKTVYVWFKDAAGNVSLSANDSINLSTVVVDVTAPANTTAFNFINSGASSTNSTSVTLPISATDAVGVTAYYASETSTTPSASASGWTAITSTTSYSASVSFTLSSSNGTKTVYVWFKDAAGNVSLSVNDSINLSTGSIPAAPIGVSAAAGNAQATISWSAVSGATSYNIYWSTTSGVSKTNGTKIASVTSPYTHTGPTNGTPYYYVVTAVNSYGESIESSQVSATPSASPGPGANFRMPDTNQTTSYTTTFGEDHDYTINPPSYTDNGNSTITDNVTGLVWQKQDDGVSKTWDNAGTYCTNLSLAGTGWRLPSQIELISIIDNGVYNPSINTTFFPGTISSVYWSSTTFAGDASGAWGVGFYGGSSDGYSKANSSYVRCVRGGQ